MKFAEYVAHLTKYLEEHPESAELPVYINNGFAASSEYICINCLPFQRPLLGKMAKKVLGKVVFLA